MPRPKQCCGNALLEFTLVGIPAVFLLISLFEMSRGMWIYHTLAYATNSAARYASLHGQGCSSNNFTCRTTVQDITNKMLGASSGLVFTTVSLIAPTSSIACNPVNSCKSNTTTWPPASTVAGQEIVIQSTYTFNSALAMFWPGSGVMTFPQFILRAQSRQRVQY